nr:protein phosphatase methylesterase 1 [Hymenolepis microstoma]
MSELLRQHLGSKLVDSLKNGTNTSISEMMLKFLVGRIGFIVEALKALFCFSFMEEVSHTLCIIYIMQKAITEDVRCQCLAVDMRGHGDTNCNDLSDYSIDTLANDIVQIIFAMFPTEAPPIILIGHSMGGAVAVHVAQKRAIPSFAGLVVIDVVEGTAIESLHSMTTFLCNRPQSFHSLTDAIAWSVKSGTIRNAESACVSFPGQLKRMSTGESATQELEKGTAIIGVSSFPTSTSPSGSSSGKTSSVHSLCGVSEEEGEDEHLEDKLEDPNPTNHPLPPINRGNGELKPSHTCSLASNRILVASHHLPPSGTSETHSQPCVSTSAAPAHSTTVTSSKSGDGYTWRIDLLTTEPFWRDWFNNMSSLFLSVPEPKLLLIAGVERLDKELTIGQMQGKFQLKILPRAGHAIHEDSPDEVASCLAQFLLRNQFTVARPNL